jgi:hypothetical protein
MGFYFQSSLGNFKNRFDTALAPTLWALLIDVVFYKGGISFFFISLRTNSVIYPLAFFCARKKSATSFGRIKLVRLTRSSGDLTTLAGFGR